MDPFYQRYMTAQDDVLIAADGSAEVLTADAPKEPAAVEEAADAMWR